MFSKNKFIDKLKECKGISSIDYIISFLVFILLVSFVFDMFLIGYKQYQVSRVATTLVRDMAKQSGLKSTVPYNFPGADNNYMTTNEAYNYISTEMKNMGIDTWNTQVTMTNRSDKKSYSFTLANNYPGYNTDYRGEISITINYDYKWGLWSQLAPGITGGSRTVTRTGFGEYKHDYTSWKGEQ